MAQVKYEIKTKTVTTAIKGRRSAAEIVHAFTTLGERAEVLTPDARRIAFPSGRHTTIDNIEAQLKGGRDV